MRSSGWPGSSTSGRTRPGWRARTLLVDGDRVRRYTGLIPKISPLAVATIAIAQLRIDRMAKRVPIERPWTATRAAEWDQRSVASWLRHCGIVRLGAPVRAIDQRSDHVVVRSDAVDVRAPHVVVTASARAHPRDRLRPLLPSDRRTLYEDGVAGPETKTLVVYDEPFWRDDGLSGPSSEPGSASEVTIDATPRSGAQGVLASFTFSRVATCMDAMDAMDPEARRAAVLAAVVTRFGPRAGAPDAVVETAWWTEEWTRGCSFAHLRPGVLSRYGPLLREPWGRVHWAGTETARVPHGAIDGAVRSGGRAAAEILSRT